MKPRNKSDFYAIQFGLPESTFATIEHKKHRERRAAINPFFSKQNIQRLEPMLTHMLEKFCARIDEFQASGQVLNLRPVYTCLMTDIISLYVMNESWNFLDSPDFSLLWADTLDAMFEVASLTKYFPWMLRLVQAIPLRLLRVMQPGLAMLVDFREVRKQRPRPGATYMKSFNRVLPETSG